jgi:SAM-dependent methyltransferase
MKVGGWLEHPLAKGRALDDPGTTEIRRRILRSKPFLRHIYEDWYRALAAALPGGEGRVLELGSGAGFVREVIPDALRSDLLPISGLDLVFDAQRIPCISGALRGIVMTNVLHHLPAPRRFLAEATRVLRPGGVVAMIEPWPTRWSRLIYTHLHHEPFDVAAREWVLAPGGPLSVANGALPWILFSRDAARLRHEFSELDIETLRPLMPFRYLVSGGIASRTLMPGWTTPAWRSLERLLSPVDGWIGMFALIVLRRR